ncbi:MAG: hypothetical protein NTY48_05100 [Candidatus Diapherotrites archaeon]|nr:hypothetical protein [Candidatus Diapherotrites archaeon]
MIVMKFKLKKLLVKITKLNRYRLGLVVILCVVFAFLFLPNPLVEREMPIDTLGTFGDANQIKGLFVGSGPI